MDEQVDRIREVDDDVRTVNRRMTAFAVADRELLWNFKNDFNKGLKNNQSQCMLSPSAIMFGQISVPDIR